MEYKKFKVAGYLRLSQEDGDKEVSDSIVSQRTIIENKIKELGEDFELADFYIDDGYTGLNTDRPAFQKMLSNASTKLAKSIQNGLNQAIQKENKREALKIEDKYIIKNVKIPITIVECGFLSNEEEEKLLQTDEYQDKLAWGIYSGIMDYFM